jgi:hypothetical protein
LVALDSLSKKKNTTLTKTVRFDQNTILSKNVWQNKKNYHTCTGLFEEKKSSFFIKQHAFNFLPKYGNIQYLIRSKRYFGHILTGLFKHMIEFNQTYIFLNTKTVLLLRLFVRLFLFIYLFWVTFV